MRRIRVQRSQSHHLHPLYPVIRLSIQCIIQRLESDFEFHIKLGYLSKIFLKFHFF
ncbi:uncharacterized protein CELE_K02E7.12 [Caenorhabditis elegans]|uniref:Uncharacterized protein n=1 Tax=Caenorhabditis elegans TaxID=6239 RepID=Q86LS3_CAEEL|nr:Uncharacterized protein CELE_K02E7.12 [Caenorhabditis elegans]CCD63504.1 Uncharacterized protein CELE_K02E7.12 [Caenorhabditis elegans]|eukprot:NP_493905.2 Uncharacterized protein CELE_K02E7.12 [Caenorhabditis elegans]